MPGSSARAACSSRSHVPIAHEVEFDVHVIGHELHIVRRDVLCLNDRTLVVGLDRRDLMIGIEINTSRLQLGELLQIRAKRHHARQNV